MIGRFSSVAIILAGLVLAVGLGPLATQQAQAADYYGTSPDLFYNYYVPPGSCGGAPAQLYLSPHPTPSVVGHTHITYPRLMPHEMLYSHHRRYIHYHGSNNRWTRTLVTWQTGGLGSGWLSPSPRPIQPARAGAWGPLLGTARY